ncbi:hypothetical protein F383_33723 [Gossypium arboreum]|uniref:Uncharacterized protein n=1 Tax=Gossypium arboreum TaxID=29729 RepID=A0A0B0PKU2_GOSAR|nr:hypothetical protein F383_33723 [Gossypium arboreum]
MKDKGLTPFFRLNHAERRGGLRQRGDGA